MDAEGLCWAFNRAHRIYKTWLHFLTRVCVYYMGGFVFTWRRRGSVGRLTGLIGYGCLYRIWVYIYQHVLTRVYIRYGFCVYMEAEGLCWAFKRARARSSGPCPSASGPCPSPCVSASGPSPGRSAERGGGFPSPSSASSSPSSSSP